MKIDLYHNIRWSRYKARVFSSLHRLTIESKITINFTQIADTSSERTSLSGVETSYHQYPHELLFPGSYDAVPAWKLVFKLFARVFRSNSDLVLIPGYARPEHWAMLVAALLTGKKRGAFCDSTLYDRPQSALKAPLKRIFFGLCNVLFGYGTRSRELLLHYGVHPDRIIYRCQAAALPDHYSVERARSNRLQQAPTNAHPHYLYVGRLSPEKSLDVLLVAFGKARQSLPGARLTLVGAGPEESALRAKAVSLDLDDSIEFTGGKNQDELGDEYARATCLVLPSRSEPWGLVVNEALHYGCPVVVSHHCGCVPELVQDGITGYVFKCNDPDDLADKLLKLTREFTHTPSVTDRCLDVISPYTPDNVASHILAGCRHVLST